MTVLKFIGAACVIAVAAALAYVRLMPINQAVFHVDPETVERPSIRGYVLLRDGADITPPVFDETKEALATRLEQIILATPRTQKQAGDLTGDFASYVTRSRFWGFPDVATVKIVPSENGASKLLIYSRQVYGLEDLGVNKARVDGWLTALNG